MDKKFSQDLFEDEIKFIYKKYVKENDSEKFELIQDFKDEYKKNDNHDEVSTLEMINFYYDISYSFFEELMYSFRNSLYYERL